MKRIFTKDDNTMATNRSIFGLRFGSNPELNPATEELRAFLKATKKPGSREVHGKDLVRYSELLEGLAAFEARLRSGAGSLDPRQKMFYGVLGQSRFVSPGLMLAVVQYKYHLHNLVALDFKKPAAFIKTAEEEGKKLNPKKKDDAAKLARLQGMVEERKGALVGLKKRQQALADELLQIGRYVRDNLVQIVKLCKASIVILVEVQVSGTMEARLIKDMTEDFKAQIKTARANGGIVQEQLDVVRKDVAALSREISSLVRDDVYSITRLYEAIHEHASEAVNRIDALITEAKKKGEGSREDDVALFSKLEQALLALVSDYHFELHTTALRSETAYEQLLLEKRKEMLEHFFDLLNRERRARSDRRIDGERRKFNELNIIASNRRTGKERRSGRSRRG